MKKITLVLFMLIVQNILAQQPYYNDVDLTLTGQDLYLELQSKIAITNSKLRLLLCGEKSIIRPLFGSPRSASAATYLSSFGPGFNVAARMRCVVLMVAIADRE